MITGDRRLIVLRLKLLVPLALVACKNREPAPVPSSSSQVASPLPPTIDAPTIDAPTIDASSLAPSPFRGISLRAGMPRARAEELISAALGRPSRYSPYGSNLTGGTVVYTSDGGGPRLEVDYNPGGPAPWVRSPDGGVEHLPPVDETVRSFRVVE